MGGPQWQPPAGRWTKFAREIFARLSIPLVVGGNRLEGGDLRCNKATWTGGSRVWRGEVVVVLLLVLLR